MIDALLEIVRIAASIGYLISLVGMVHTATFCWDDERFYKRTTLFLSLYIAGKLVLNEGCL